MAAAAICLPREDELWNGSRETLEQRMEYFLGNEALADMTFLVGDDRRRIPGHKFILSSCSWDFYNALHLLRIDNEELRIEDVPYESFLDFLCYCYTGRLNLKLENANNIMKLAYRFEMKPLIKKCETEIWKVIDRESCLKLFTQCDFLPKDSPIKIQILDAIAVNFLHIMENESIMESFTELSLKAVEEIADVMFLPCEEVKMFEALMKWSTRACEKAEINPTPQKLRKALAHVFKKIRFPTMRSEDFMRIVAKYPTMFTNIEIANIAKKKQTGTLEDIDESSIFPNINRKINQYGIPVPRLLSDTRDVVATCLIDSTLSSIVQMRGIGTVVNKFSVGFKVRSPKKLLGFALIDENDQEVPLPLSCQFLIKCSSCDEHDFMNTKERSYYGSYCSCSYEEMTVTLEQKQKLSNLRSLEDFCVFPTFFSVEKFLEPNQFYTLRCQYLDYVCTPVIAKTKNYFGLEEVIFSNKESPIPFLYFAK